MAEEKTAQEKLDRLGAIAFGMFLGVVLSGAVIFAFAVAMDIWRPVNG